MALINCTKCGAEISDKARRCPECGKKTKAAGKIIIIAVCILTGILASIAAASVVRKIEERKEYERQVQISEVLDRLKEFYLAADFDNVEVCINELDNLEYDTTVHKDVLEYDRNVYAPALDFYNNIRETQSRVREKKYTSISQEYKNFKAAAEAFEDLPENPDSKIGRWISSLKNSADYKAFKSTILGSYADSVEDNSFTDWIPAETLAMTLELLKKYEFPIEKIDYK